MAAAESFPRTDANGRPSFLPSFLIAVVCQTLIFEQPAAEGQWAVSENVKSSPVAIPTTVPRPARVLIKNNGSNAVVIRVTTSNGSYDKTIPANQDAEITLNQGESADAVNSNGNANGTWVVLT